MGGHTPDLDMRFQTTLTSDGWVPFSKLGGRKKKEESVVCRAATKLDTVCLGKIDVEQVAVIKFRVNNRWRWQWYWLFWDQDVDECSATISVSVKWLSAIYTYLLVFIPEWCALQSSSEIDMGWVNPWVGLGWVRIFQLVMGWVGLAFLFICYWDVKRSYWFCQNVVRNLAWLLTAMMYAA